MKRLLHKLIHSLSNRRDLTRWQSVAVVAGIVAIVLGGAGVFVSRLNAQIAEEAHGRLTAFVGRQAADVDALIQSASSDIKLARQNAVFEREILASSDAVPAADRALIESGIRYMGERYGVDEICLIRANGAEMARYNGGMVASVDALSPDESVSNPAFKPTMQLPDDSVFVTEPYVSPDSLRWVYGFATPVVLEDGRRGGILHFEIPVEGVVARMTAITFHPTAFSFLLQSDGHLLAHPQLSEYRAAQGIPDDPAGAFPDATALGDPSWNAAVTRMLAYGTGETSYDVGGRTYSISFASANGGADIVGTAVPNDILLADVQRARTDLLVTLAPLTLLILVISAWFASRLRAAHLRLAASSKQSAQLAAIVVSADDAILRTDLDGRIVTWNRGAERMYGYNEEQATGRRVTELVVPERRKDVDHLLANVARGEPVELHETVHQRRDDTQFDAAITLSPIRDDAGAVTASSVIVRDITGRKQLERELSHQALHDALTGLPNRPLFIDRLAHALQSTRRPENGKHRQVAVLFLDVDDFKVINDSLGHRIGDELLRAIANRLSTAIRPGDTCSRLGGDEFTVLLENVSDVRLAERTARRLLDRFESAFELEGHRVVVSVSIGVALSADTLDPDELLRQADLAMYDAKGRGKARFAVFDQSMDDRAWQRLQLETELRNALSSGQLDVHYQPIFELATGVVHSVEALVRWRHPRRGWVLPNDFIPLSEQTGLIVQIGDFVLATALKQLKTWTRAGHGKDVTMSVNVSPRQLREPDFVANFSKLLAEFDIEANRLQLEITESLLQEDEACIATVGRLREMGVHVALDDFGTGYSSLGSIRRLPIDSLKIDRSFVSGGSESAQDSAIVSAAVGFASAVGLQITAEGIETSEQLAALQALGCRFGQGFFLAEALPADEIVALMSTRKDLGSPLESVAAVNSAAGEAATEPKTSPEDGKEPGWTVARSPA